MNDFKIEFDESNVAYVNINEYILKLELTPLPDEYKDYASQELRETPENVIDGLNKLKKLIQDEEDLNLPIDDDAFLLKFLRPCHFYPDSAFTRIKGYYKFKKNHKDLCADLLPENISKVLRSGLITIMPLRDIHGRRIMYVQLGKKWKTKEYSLNDIFRAMMLTVEAAAYEPITQVNGAIVILDMESLSLGQIYQFGPSFAKMTLDWIQDCLPVRLKAVHVINQPYLFNMLYQIFKPFLREKLRKRVHFHGKNRQFIENDIGSHVLPKFLGGTANFPDLPGYVLDELFRQFEKEFRLCMTLGYVKTVS